MRIWTIHPKYLDRIGIVALWRETLLAKHVLEGRSKGYSNHPQLDRFKNTDNPVDSINQYLTIVYRDSVKRGYRFNKDKINWEFKQTIITVTSGQLKYEVSHLLKKLKNRDIQSYIKIKKNKKFDVHPMFQVVEGSIENWEKIQ